ncbi:hypothetical protein ACIQJX_25810 [Streptomyces griseoviridis]
MSRGPGGEEPAVRHTASDRRPAATRRRATNHHRPTRTAETTGSTERSERQPNRHTATSEPANCF